MVFTFGRKDPSPVSMCRVVQPQSDEGRHWEWNKPISRPLAAMDMNKHPFGVDIGNLEMECFLESESERIDGGKEAQHGGLFDEFQKDLNFADSENGRQLEFRLDLELFKSRPIARTGFGEEEFQGAVSDVDGAVAP